MRLPTSFSPIEVNEIDNFAFDFTADVGSGGILSTSWSCKIAPFQTATDEAPSKEEILQATVEPLVQLRSSLNGSLQAKAGFFQLQRSEDFRHRQSARRISSKQLSGSSDGRVLSLSSTVQCAP